MQAINHVCVELSGSIATGKQCANQVLHLDKIETKLRQNWMGLNVQEQLEARLMQKRSEVKSLNVKLETVQRKLSQHSADAQLANQQTTLTMTQAQHQITGCGQQLLHPLYNLPLSPPWCYPPT